MVDYLKLGQGLMKNIPQTNGGSTTVKLGKECIEKLSKEIHPTLDIAQKVQGNYGIASLKLSTGDTAVKVLRQPNKPASRTIYIGDEERLLVNTVNKKGISTDKIFTPDRKNLLQETIVDKRNLEWRKYSNKGYPTHGEKVTKINYPTTQNEYKEVITEISDYGGDTVSYTKKLKELGKNGKTKDVSRTVKRKFGEVSTSDGKHKITDCREKYVSRTGNGGSYVQYTGKNGDRIQVYYDKKGNIIREGYSPAQTYPSTNNVNNYSGSIPPNEPPHIHTINT